MASGTQRWHGIYQFRDRDILSLLVALQALEGLERCQNFLESQTIPDLPRDNAQVLKRMISTGIYQYLKQPVPACITEDQWDGSTVREWPRNLLEECCRPKQVCRYSSSEYN